MKVVTCFGDNSTLNNAPENAETPGFVASPLFFVLREQKNCQFQGRILETRTKPDSFFNRFVQKWCKILRLVFAHRWRHFLPSKENKAVDFHQ